jgi:hypothetical protein
MDAILNEEIYEEVDDDEFAPDWGFPMLPNSTDFQLGLRMQEAFQQNLATREALYRAANARPLPAPAAPTTQTPGMLEFYENLNRQYPQISQSQSYPLLLTDNSLNPGISNPTVKLLDSANPNFGPQKIVSPTYLPESAVLPPTPLAPLAAPCVEQRKMPLEAVYNGRVRLSRASSIPYEVQNSHRAKRNLTAPAEMQNGQLLVNPYSALPITTNTTQPTFNTMPLMSQTSMAPFTTQLPLHMQQYYNLPEFNANLSSGVGPYNLPFSDSLHSSPTVPFSPAQAAFSPQASIPSWGAVSSQAQIPSQAPVLSQPAPLSQAAAPSLGNPTLSGTKHTENEVDQEIGLPDNVDLSEPFPWETYFNFDLLPSGSDHVQGPDQHQA